LARPVKNSLPGQSSNYIMKKDLKNYSFLSHFPSATRRLGEILGKEIIKAKLGKTALVLALNGDLGSGKTTFLQGLAKGLRIKSAVLSPTFVVMKRLSIGELSRPKDNELHDLFHIDCYRIRKPKELLNLGFRKIINNNANVVAIEWAERIKSLLPKNSIVINFRFVDNKTREIEVLSLAE